MEELEEVYNDFERKNKRYTKEEYVEFKRQEKQDLYDLIDSTALEIANDGNKFKQFLDIQGNFEQYSVGNCLALVGQMPEATIVRDYESWRSLGGYPRKEHVDLKILEPGDSYMREDGSVGVSWNVKYVIDISQVNIKNRPKKMRYNEKLLLRTFLNCSRAKVEMVSELPITDKSAYYNSDENVLYVKRGSNIPEIFYDVTEALSEQEMGKVSSIDNFYNKCVSYMLCRKYGIDVSKIDITNIPGELKLMDAREIREHLQPIHNAMENLTVRANKCIEVYSKQNKEKVNER